MKESKLLSFLFWGVGGLVVKKKVRDQMHEVYYDLIENCKHLVSIVT